MKLFSKNIDINFEIRPVFLRTLSRLFLLLFILGYFLARWLNIESLVSILSFTTSSAIFWIIIIFILLGHIEFFEKIVKDIARSKVSEFATSSYFRESVTQLLNDDNFKEGVRNIIDPKTSTTEPPVIPSEQEELDTGNKL